MKIKQLEIQGFKSFADRTIVQFQDGITGIVGPNGCGKSNVVDAIRWVMGEMSAKHLRGREMQDIIFSGSDKRPPASMAEVVLVLSNEEGRAPAAYAHFSEISVSRRLYRSGESEYAINKSICRLRDIYDLFLGTGVGTKAYSIVEQGQIGQIITSKPEDRRRIIEEAAGISKFKARKEAALRKMEGTQNNLTRLQDILGELSRQINSLDRQAKKAEKFRVIRDELKGLELHLASHDFIHETQDIHQAEKDLGVYAEQEVQQGAQLATLESDCETLKLQITAEEQEISKKQESLYDKNNQLKLHEQGVQFKNRELSLLAEQEMNALKEIEEIKLRLKQGEESLSQINEQQIKIDLLVAQSDEEFSNFEAVVQVREDQTKVLNQELEELQREVLRLVQLASEGASKQELISHQKIDLKGRIAKNQAEIEEIDRQLKNWVGRLHQDQEALSEFNQLKLGLSSQSENVEQAIQRERDELETEKSKLSELKEDLSRKRSRLASLLEIQRNFEDYQEGVRQVLLKKDSNERLREVYGTVADVVEAEPRYQTAVGAVLGEKLQYVVVKSQQVGVEAVEYLKTESAGRSSFVPVSLRNYAEEGEFPASGQEGVVGPLKHFIKAKEDYQPVVDYLFRDVWLIENLNRAVQIWNSNGHRKTLVTLEGEVVDPSGIVSGGGPANHAVSLLEKKHEIKKLEEEVRHLEIQVRFCEEEFKKHESRIQNLASSLDHLKKDSHSEEIKIVNLQKDLGHLKSEITRLNQRRDALSLEIAAWLKEEQEIELGLEKWNQQANSANQSRAEKEENLNQIRSRVSEEQKELDKMKEELTRRRLEAQNAHERKMQIEREVKRLLDDKTSLSLRQEECLRHITQGNQEGARLRKEVAESEEAIKLLAVEVDSLNQSLSAHRRSFEEYQYGLREKELALKEIRRGYEEVKTAHHTVLIRLTERRGKVQFLKEQIFERYHDDLSLIANQYQDRPLENRAEVENTVNELREKLSKIGSVNVEAIDEYETLKGRYDFLNTQAEDLKNSLDSLNRVIHKINRSTRQRFQETFEAVNQKFQDLFPTLFKGGRAKLVLTDEANLLETGVEIVAQPPGKKLQSISLLSGGEKALTAVSLIFAIFLCKPSPFCILDEVDAPLDDVNVDRFNEMVKNMTDRSQFILITHNKRTMEMANILYGITMEEAGVSRTVSVNLREMAA